MAVDAAAEAEPAPKPVGDDVGEIVVTANRRQTTLQKYAGTVTALTPQDLDRKGIKSVRDIQTPAVEIGTAESNVEIYIRGVGTDYNTELGDPAVATHIDGVYIPRPRGMGSMLFDVERVEIAEGPQGTLRGRNAAGGAVNVVTAKPVLGELLGETTFQLGNYSQRLTRGMVNIPIGDLLAVRLAGYGEVRDPYYKNAGPVKTITPAENANSLAYRASLLFEPWKELKITLQHDFTQERGTGYSGSNFYPALSAGLQPSEVPDPRAVLYRGPQPSQDLVHWGVSGNIQLDLGEHVQLEYLGSYRNLSFQQVSAGNDGVAFPGYTNYNADNWGTSYWDTGSKSIVQEVRLHAPDSDRLRWTAGGFFFNESQRAFLGSTVDNSTGYFGQEWNHPSVTDHSYAGYADMIYDIMKSWRGTAGARVTTESKSRDGIGYQYGFSGITTPQRFGTEGFRYAGVGRTDYTAGPDTIGDFLNGIASFGSRDTLQNAIQQPGVTLNISNLPEQHGKYTSTFADFRLGTDFDLSPNNLMYVMFSTAHKSGGFNDNIGSIAPTFKPEALYAAEVGSKNKFFNGKLIANVAAFWYEYRNQQFSAVREIMSSGMMNTAGAGTSVRFNAAQSRVLGLEGKVTGHLPAGFVADVGALLLDARIAEGAVADTRLGWDAMSQGTVDISGNQLPRSPRLSVSYALSQSIQTGIGKFYWSVAAQTRTAQYMTIFNGDGRDSTGKPNPNLNDKVPSYTQVDINAGFTPTNNRLRVELFVINLTDIAYMTTFINQPSLNLRFFNPPRQIGGRLTVML